MKVGLVTSIPRGGPVEHAVLLARDLITLGVEVRAVAVDERIAARFAAVGARVAVIPLVRPFDPAGAVRVRRFLRGVDVIHTHDRRSGLWVRVLPRAGDWRRTRHAGGPPAPADGPAPPARRGPLRVHTLHGLPEPFLTDAPPSLKARAAYRGLDRGLRRFTDVLVTPSHAMAQLLAERVGYDVGELVVVPNGVDVPLEPLPRGDLVGTIALLEPVKGLEYLIEAAKRLPDARFVDLRHRFAGGRPARAGSRPADRVRGVRPQRRGAEAAVDLRAAVDHGEQPAGAARGARVRHPRRGQPRGRDPGVRPARHCDARAAA